jgi:hypothetical protein
MNHIEAMKLALEALEFAASQIYNENDDDIIAEAIAALRQALEQPEQTVSLEEYKRLQRLVTSQGIRLMEYESKQEPVAWMYVNKDGECEQIEFGDPFNDPSVTLLYTAPPKREWVGLTDDELDELAIDEDGLPNSHLEFGWAIEAKLKEKNT